MFFSIYKASIYMLERDVTIIKEKMNAHGSGGSGGSGLLICEVIGWTST